MSGTTPNPAPLSPPPVVTPPSGGALGNLPLMLIFAGVVGLGVLAWWMMQRDTAKPDANAIIRASGQGEPYRPAENQRPAAETERQPQRQEQRPREEATAGVERPRPAPMAVYTRPRPRPPVAPPGSAATVNGPETPQQIAGMTVLRAQTFDDAGYYLMPGDKIACINNEPIVGRQGAFFSATIPEEVRGRDNRVLIPRYSRAVGKILKALDDGDVRVAAILTHIEGPTVQGRPTMVVSLGNAAAGDPLGGIDLEGTINTRFWERLGATAAYAGLDTISRVGSSLASDALSDSIGGRGGVNINNFSGSRGLAGRAFDHEMQKSPTINRPHGQPCTIFINQPIDFRSIAR